MAQEVLMQVIARIHTPFSQKFGIPRQSGLADTPGTIVFEPEFRDPNALRGLEEYSHLWLVWQFSQARQTWSPTVRPPRLGGNRRMGVFATRSPYRPNPIGLSCVRLQGVDLHTDQGPVIHVLGADLKDGTPILDIKPYLAYADSFPEARGGFTDRVARRTLRVEDPGNLLEGLASAEREALGQVLACDPRPSYQADPHRIYGMAYGAWEVRFRVEDQTLYVLELTGKRRDGESND